MSGFWHVWLVLLVTVHRFHLSSFIFAASPGCFHDVVQFWCSSFNLKCIRPLRVPDQLWLPPTRDSPSQKPSVWWKAHRRSVACTPSSGQHTHTLTHTFEWLSLLMTSVYSCRNKETNRDEFIFYSKRLMRLLIEHALSFLPLKVCVWTNPQQHYSPLLLFFLLLFLQSVSVETPQGGIYNGKRLSGKRVSGFKQIRDCAPYWKGEYCPHTNNLICDLIGSKSKCRRFKGVGRSTMMSLLFL